MSEKTIQEDPIHEQVKKQAEVETLKQKVQEEELIIRARVADSKLRIIKENDKNTEIAKSINYGQMSTEEIEKVTRKHRIHGICAQ